MNNYMHTYLPKGWPSNFTKKIKIIFVHCVGVLPLVSLDSLAEVSD